VRKPTINPGAAAEAKRVRDAIDAARDALEVMIRNLQSDKTHPIARNTMEFVIDFLTDHADGNKLIGKYQSASLDQIVLFLQKCRLPLGKHGRPATELRNVLLADIIEDIRCRDFDVHRGDATKEKDAAKNKCVQQSACSIVATAWRELESEVRENREPRRTPLRKLGFAPLNRIFGSSLPAETKPLGESRLETIWDESEWATKAHVRKAKARAKTGGRHAS
jgi:hypothetical protein